MPDLPEDVGKEEEKRDAAGDAPGVSPDEFLIGFGAVRGQVTLSAAGDLGEASLELQGLRRRILDAAGIRCEPPIPRLTYDEAQERVEHGGEQRDRRSHGELGMSRYPVAPCLYIH